jgi:hypothetical protein
MKDKSNFTSNSCSLFTNFGTIIFELARAVFVEVMINSVWKLLLWILHNWQFLQRSFYGGNSISIKSILIILLLDQPFCFTIKNALVWKVHSMLIFLNNFFCLFTVCLVLMNLLLESSKHTLFRLRCLLLGSLYITRLLLQLFFFLLKFRGEFTYKTFVWILLFFTDVFYWCLCNIRSSCSWFFILNFINNLCNHTFLIRLLLLWFRLWLVLLLLVWLKL